MQPGNNSVMGEEYLLQYFRAWNPKAALRAGRLRHYSISAFAR